MFFITPLMPEECFGRQTPQVSPTTCPQGVTSAVDVAGDSGSGCGADFDPFVPISRARRESTADCSLGMRWVSSAALRWNVVRSVLARMSFVSASANASANLFLRGISISTLHQKILIDNRNHHRYIFQLMAHKPQKSEYASTRLSTPVYRQVTKMADEERRTLSMMLHILVEEAITARNGKVKKNGN